MAPRWRALLVLTAARTTMGVLFQSLVSVYPALAVDMPLNHGELGFLVGLYFLPGAFIALPAAAAGRRYGDKRMVLAGLSLMAVGAVLSAAADSMVSLGGARLLSGVGAVLLNVVMSKMVTDWFAGKETALAMSIFVNSFPIGIGLALLGYGWLLSFIGWRLGFLACTLLVAIALVLVLFAYRKHANDRAGAATPAARLGRTQLTLVCLAGAIWGLYNGGFAAMISFAPTALQAAGNTASQAATIVALTTWAVVASIQAGGILSQKWMGAPALMAVGLCGWAGCLLLAGVPSLRVAAVILAGCIMGLPVGSILALPSHVLLQRQRAIGMGLFYVWLYLGHGLVPPVVGWVQDHVHRPSAALPIVAMVVLCALCVYGMFLVVARARTSHLGSSAS